MGADSAEKKLVAYGEAFMQMFDDYEPEVTAPTPQNAAARPIEASKSGQAGSTADASKGKNKHKADAPELPAQQASNGRKRHRVSVAELDDSQQMDTLFQARQASGNASGPSGKQLPARTSTTDRLLAKQDRRNFMSPKASDVHAAKPSAVGWRSAPEADEMDLSGPLSPDDFRKLQREVELYGSKALTKKERKKWQASFLERMGAASEKSPRTPARIGKGIAKKSAERQAKATETAIETGMMKRKGTGKAKKMLKAKQRDKGLMEAGSSFRNGVMFVNKKLLGGPPSGGRSLGGQHRRK